MSEGIRGALKWLVATQVRLWVTAGVAVLLFVVWIVSGSHHFQECVKANDAAYAEQALQKGIGTFIRVRKWCLGEFIDANGESLTGLFTVVLAISTIGLWVVTGRTLRHAERSSERQLRAYVTIISTEIEKVRVNFVPRAEIRIQNTGQTSAYDTYILNNMLVARRYPLPEGADLPAVQIRFADGKIGIPKCSHGVLGPSQTTATRGDSGGPLSPEDYAGITNGSRALYFYGFASYRDTFGKFWRLHFRYFVGGLAHMLGVDEMMVEKVYEEEIDERTHWSVLRNAGKEFPVPSFSFGKVPPQGETTAPGVDT